MTASVKSAIRVMEAVSQLQPAGLSEIARVAQIPKSSTQRFLLTLAEVGWLEPSGDKPTTWSITLHASAVCGRGSGRTLRDAALPVLSDLQSVSTETVHLVAPDGDELVLVERLDTAHALRAFLALGSRIPLHASATGLAYLSARDKRYVERYLSGPLQPSTVDTMTDPVQIRRALYQTQSDRYSINVGGLSTGISSLGAPIVSTRSGVVHGAVSVSGPSTRIVPDRFEELGALVAEAAARIGSRLP